MTPRGRTAKSARLAAVALMLGNFVTGLAVLAPAGMLGDLAAGLSVSVRDTGLLITFGAVVLCFGSPLMVWATSAVERRRLLGVTLAVLAIGQTASALAPNYASLLAIRLPMLAFAAIFTPQAASTIALIVPVKERPGAIAFVFLGWSMMFAAGMPLVALLAAQFGWRATFGALGAITTVSFVLLLIGVPAGVRDAPVSFRSWGEIARNRKIVLLLLITALWPAGQFVIFPYLGPLLGRLAGAGAQAIGAVFAVLGVMAFLGNVIATRTVKKFGPFVLSLCFLLAMFLGTLVWTLGAGTLIAMGVGAALWGLGFAAFNSMQQARLVAAAPGLASATIALNTSLIYVGQAGGSALGGVLFAQNLPRVMGYVAGAFMGAALVVLALTRPAKATRVEP